MTLIAIAITTSYIVACNRSKSAEAQWHTGALYAVKNDDGKYGVVKILVLEPDAVHIRAYQQTFPARPTWIDPSSLTLGPFTDKEHFSIGHLPLSRASFSEWQPTFISQQSVSEDELEGYKLWKDSSRKTF